jgi:Restriction endonuclease BpuJI - N terminal/Domain of unknown function (DUF3883)
MSKQQKYKIPDEYFFRLHHVRPRYKDDVEEALLYVVTSIAELDSLEKKEYKTQLNSKLREFKNNRKLKEKTIDNWRTEISAIFALIQEKDNYSKPSKMAVRLANNQYLDEFFNYFLYSFQYPGGHIVNYNVINQIYAGVKFKPCTFILQLLIEGEKLTGKPFSVTAEELTHCAYFDLRVTRDGKHPKDVAKMIIQHRVNNVEFDYEYEQLRNKTTGEITGRGDINRYAGDILDYMVLANLLQHKGTGYYYSLNKENLESINFHLQNEVWFSGYDKYFGEENIAKPEIKAIEEVWFDFVNQFDGIEAFAPHLDHAEQESISALIQEYYSRMTGDKKMPTKIIGDYGESLILAHEYLRTKDKTNRQHLINKIPTPLGVGYDIQSVEVEKKKRYIEVKTTKSRKAITNNRFKLTPNEWDTAETIGDNYFIYYLVVNENSKNIFVIQNPVKQYEQGNLKIDKNLVVEFSKTSGQWEKLLEIRN